MERMLVVVFESDVKAAEGSHALEELGELGRGTIAVNVARVVARDSRGTTTVIDTSDTVPEGALGGTVVGSLIGMLGGPVGLAIGAVSGFVAGATTDFARTHAGADFVSQVSNALAPGKAALVAEIDEESTEAVDERMQALGGVVYRRSLSEVADAAYQHDRAGIEAEIARLKAEHARSRAERRAKLQSRIDALMKKLQTLGSRAVDHANR